VISSTVAGEAIGVSPSTLSEWSDGVTDAAQ
jgi:hypothetical protein